MQCGTSGCRQGVECAFHRAHLGGFTHPGIPLYTGKLIPAIEDQLRRRLLPLRQAVEQGIIHLLNQGHLGVLARDNGADDGFLHLPGCAGNQQGLCFVRDADQVTVFDHRIDFTRHFRQTRMKRRRGLGQLQLVEGDGLLIGNGTPDRQRGVTQHTGLKCPDGAADVGLTAEFRHKLHRRIVDTHSLQPCLRPVLRLGRKYLGAAPGLRQGVHGLG